jgi:two-component system, LytTR family, response regulator
MVIRAGGKVVFLDTREIDWIEAAANYVKPERRQRFVFAPIRYRAAFREGFDQDRFIRIHRSVIVNVRKIKELQPFEGGEYIAILKNGKELSCSRG